MINFWIVGLLARGFSCEVFNTGFGAIVDGYKTLKCNKAFKAMIFLFSGSIIRGFIFSIYLNITHLR